METTQRARAGRWWPMFQGSVSLLSALVALWFAAAPLLARQAGASPVVSQPSPVVVRLAPAEHALDGPALAPGGERFRPLVVTNDGPSAFRYRVGIDVAPGGEALAGALRLEARAVAGACDADAFGAAAGQRLAEPLPLNQVDDIGGRVLEPGAAETLCVRVWLPADAPASLSGASAEVVVRVTAVQR